MKRFLPVVLLVAGCHFITDPESVPMPAPSGLEYSAGPVTYVLGQPIADNVPSAGGGPAASIEIDPSLPEGLSFDTSTGIISGTPTVLSLATTYTVTASNPGGSTTAALTITVIDTPPSGLSYSSNTVVHTLGRASADNAPSSQGGRVVSYDVSPPLPAGLSLDPATGVISGTPAELAPEKPYTITATNSGGSTTATLSITVNDVPPSALTYSTSQAVYTRGRPIMSNAPSSEGGAVVSYSITPDLLDGLSLDQVTGVISGAPTILSQGALYTVTATNSGGSTTASVSISVREVAPSNLTYSSNPAVYTKGQTIPDNTPSSEGGAPDSYAITPSALPPGLSFNTTTGVISGAPSALQQATAYAVTATNSGGSTPAALTITVNDVPPSCAYLTNPATYTNGQTIQANTLSCSGGPATSISISPSLPQGLSMSQSTGAITGTPTVISPATDYTITVSNSGGSTTVTLNIRVDDVPPSGCAYLTNPVTYTRGQAIQANTLSCSGGPVTAVSSSPSLPQGLSLSSSTGAITGTPTVISPATDYTVTVSNSGGSTTVTLNIRVNDVPPSGCTYSSNPATYTKGQAIPTNTLSCSGGGPVTAVSSNPPLPLGLSPSQSTGAITGTPSVLSSATNYTVTVSNSGGSTTVTLNIRVNDVPPSGCTYSNNPATYTKGQAIPTNTLSCSGGGPVTAVSSSPPLPLGLIASQSTGAITGTPTVVSSATNYTITISNSGGSTTVTLNIRVNDVPPSGCTYSSNPATYTKGQAIPTNTLSCSGGAVTAVSSSPPLPQGLSPSQSTGAITGTPTVISPTTNYVVTVSNSGGSTTVTLTITVNDVPPSGCTYSSNPATYTKGQAIPTNTLSCSGGGPVTAVSSSPPLPQGLSPSQSTGAITGTPTVIGTTTHAVTISNSGGATSIVLTIIVNDAPPSGCTYSSNPATYTKGQAIPTNTLSCSGGGPVTAVSSSPPLPLGLSPSQSTGAITGTPSVLSSATNYTVTVSNSGGSTTVTLNIRVNDVPPSNLSYSENPAVYEWSQTITPNVPSSTGGAVVSYTVTPALPPGLSLHSGLGTIGGTPTIISSGTYTVKATNTGGSTTVSLSITVSCLATDAPCTVIAKETQAAGIQTIVTGGDRSCAIVDGRAWCWGRNTHGQLGDGSTVDSQVPVLVSGLPSGVKSIAVGAAHTCAVVDGGAWCWGENAHGQLGDDSTIDSRVPVSVSGLSSGVERITAGAAHSCAVVNGGVRCWGDNLHGQLGDGYSADSHEPVQVAGLRSGVQGIAAGFVHTCAVVDGGAWCWGGNLHGQLGAGSTSSSRVPLPVDGLSSGVQAVTAGAAHSCATTSSGVRCWGDQQLGGH